VSGETGTVEPAETAPVSVRSAGKVAGRVATDWRERFSRSYDIEVQERVDASSVRRPASYG
jgi:myo-inositol 2-dehydrogenase/D-chiro-inositol 1-dehydrogenase